MTLEQLLCAVSEGQAGAWKRLVPELSRHLHRLFRGPRLSEADVDDLVQITLLAVYRQLPGFTPRKSYRAWVFGIARNQARLALRQRERLSRIHERFGRIVGSPETGPSTILRRVDLFDLAKQEVAELPEHYRAAIEHFLDEGDAGTLAEQTGLTRASARARRSRALELLRTGVRQRMIPARPTPSS